MSGITFKKNEKRIPVILFLGAGVSFSSGIRTAGSLKDQFIQEVKTKDDVWKNLTEDYSNNSSKSIQDLADDLEIRASPSKRYEFKDWIARNLYSQSSVISPEYRMLAFLAKKRLIDAVYTTNQDVCLERALDLQGILYNRYAYPYNEQNLEPNANQKVDIFKLCGDLHTPYQMCFSETELHAASESPLFNSLLSYFNKKCRIIFIGYSAADDPIRKALRRASECRRNHRTAATLYFVDINKKEGHSILINSDYGDEFIKKTAEKYLLGEIWDMKPSIDVKHALVSRNGFGGIQTYAYSLMALQKRFESNVKSSTYATRSFHNNSNSKKKRLYGFSYDLASNKAETIKAICAERPDVIHAHNFIAAHTAESLGVPCVFTSHSLESTEMNSPREKYILADLNFPADPFAKDLPKYEDIYYRHLPTILALSESHIKEFHEDVRPSAKRVVAPFLHPEWLGIETNVTSQEKRKSIINASLSPKCITSSNIFDENTPTISFFGRPDTRKGLHIFDRIVEILHSKGTHFQALYVGPRIIAEGDSLFIEEERTSYEQSYYALYTNGRTVTTDIQKRMFVATEMIEDYPTISFQEHLKKMYNYYLASDVIIIPSSYETFGYVALEAMSCRRPVIASNIDGLQYLLGEGRGILIDIEAKENDTDRQTDNLAQRFVGAIEQILNHRENKYTPKAKNQIKKAKEWVDQTYSEDNMKRLVQEMYEHYLNSIIHGRKTDETVHAAVADELAKTLKYTEQWDDLLSKSSVAYQNLRQKLYSSSTEHAEIYELFWNIAYWLKTNKSTCPEVSMLQTKELAELITDVTRFMPKEPSAPQESSGEENRYWLDAITDLISNKYD